MTTSIRRRGGDPGGGGGEGDENPQVMTSAAGTSQLAHSEVRFTSEIKQRFALANVVYNWADRIAFVYKTLLPQMSFVRRHLRVYIFSNRS